MNSFTNIVAGGVQCSAGVRIAGLYHDSLDSEGPLPAEHERMEQLDRQLHYMEDKGLPDVSAIDSQVDDLWSMRPELIELLIDAHASFALLPQTLFLAINLLDRYCSKQTVYGKYYKLAGCSALLIASKFVDHPDDTPHVQALHTLCQGDYDYSMFIKMERHILTTLDWSIGCATVDAFLQLMAAMENRDEEVRHMATYLCELSLSYRTFVATKPSVMARSCLAVAGFILGRAGEHLGLWNAIDYWILSAFCNPSEFPSEAAAHKYSGGNLSQVSQKLKAFRDQRASLLRTTEDGRYPLRL